jgi:hypothetical protein
MKHAPIEKAYHKVVAVIESCKTPKHLEAALQMVMNFRELYGIVGYPKALSYSLDRLIDKQQTTWI